MNNELLQKANELYQKKFGKSPSETKMTSISTWNKHFVYAPSEKILDAFFEEDKIIQTIIPIVMLVVVVPIFAGTTKFITDAINLINSDLVVWMMCIYMIVPILILVWAFCKVCKLNKIQKNQITLIKMED